MDTSRVIVEKMYTINDVIHSMTWPSLVVVICGLVFLRLQTRRHKLTLCGRRGSPVSRTAVNNFVKQPLRQLEEVEEERSEGQSGDNDDQPNVASTSCVMPTTSAANPAAASAAAADYDADDGMRCEEYTESHLTAASPQLCSTSSSTSSVRSSSQQRLPVVSWASSPTLADEWRRSDTCRPIRTSHSAVDMTTWLRYTKSRTTISHRHRGPLIY